MSNEEIYDTEIAPELKRLCARCQELGMSFVASVEYDAENGGRGRTEWMAKDFIGTLSCAQRIVHWAARCNGNIDRLFMACDKHGREHGHSSMYLQSLGNKNVKFGENEFAALMISTPSERVKE